MKSNLINNRNIKNKHRNSIKASLTVEAALVMPIFLYLLIAFIYFIQVFTIQEHIQSGITKMGLSLSRTAYVYKDFLGTEEVQSFDQSVFGEELDIGLHEMAGSVINHGFLRLYSRSYLDENRIDLSCIKNGYNGLSFYYSTILDESDYIDIVVNYTVKIPIKIFTLEEMNMVQRVKLRGWTGYEVAACYSITEENDSEEETIVYITETGTVYHTDQNCSHISFSIQAVFGLPSELRNNGGAKYYPCEACCSGNESPYGTYYLTTYGTRYHRRNDCPKIKRTVTAIPLSKAGGRSKCKRCGG